MRGARARGRPRGRDRDRQRGHRRLARRRPAGPPRHRGRAARGVTLEGAARQIRPRDFEDFDLLLAMDRENLRELRTFAPDGEAAAKARLLREFDPASAGAPDLDVPDPYYGGPDGFETVLDQVEAACRGLLESCDEPRGRGARRHRPRAAGGGARRRRRHQRRLPRPVRGRVVRLRQDPRGRRARRVRGRGGGPALARASRARCACPRCSASATSARARLGRRGRPRRPRRVRRGPRGGARGGRAGVRRHTAARGRCGSAPLALPNDPAPDWPTFYARAASAAAARTRGPLAGGARRRAASATGCRSSPARPSRRPGCTATCGAATCCGVATGARG